MTVPTVIGDLSTTASSNSPAGSDSPIEADNFLRAHAAFIAQLNANKADKASPTFTGTPAAPTAAVDTNTTQVATTAYVVGQGYAKLASPTFTGTVTAAALTTTGNTILGDASTDTLNVGNGGLVKDASGLVGIGTTTPGTIGGQLVVQQDTTQQGVTINAGSGIEPLLYFRGGLIANLRFNDVGLRLSDYADSERMRIDSSGNIISGVTTSAPTLASNYQMVFNLTSDTNLRVSVRGSDGVTRTANITLA